MWQELDLSGNAFIGTLPSNLNALSFLQDLSLSNTYISDPLPLLSTLTSLECVAPCSHGFVNGPLRFPSHGVHAVLLQGASAAEHAT
jgi:hypothetical protein